MSRYINFAQRRKEALKRAINKLIDDNVNSCHFKQLKERFISNMSSLNERSLNSLLGITIKEFIASGTLKKGDGKRYILPQDKVELNQVL